MLLRAVDGDAHMRPVNAAFDGVLGGYFDARKTERIHFLQKGDLVRKKLEQRAHQHIASRAHGAVKIDRFHAGPPR